MTGFNKKGFTLVELMLAMTLFIFVIMVATVGFVGINRTFSKGLVRKELSEGVQRLVEDVSLTIRNEGSFSEGGESNKKCSQTTCYEWGEDVGVKKVVGTSTTTILDARYVLDFLKIEPIGTDLYRVTGIARTKDRDAFRFADEEKYPGENQDIVCKGTAENENRSNCALEKFNFVVRTTGDAS